MTHRIMLLQVCLTYKPCLSFVEKCAAGKYYDAEAELCRPCGHGSYQPREGAFTCMACPRGQTTRATEAVSAAECRDDCPSGKMKSLF